MFEGDFFVVASPTTNMGFASGGLSSQNQIYSVFLSSQKKTNANCNPPEAKPLNVSHKVIKKKTRILKTMRITFIPGLLKMPRPENIYFHTTEKVIRKRIRFCKPVLAITI